MVLGKLQVPGRPKILISAGQGPIALAVGARGGGLEIFYSHLSFSSFSISLGDGPILTEIVSKRAVKPKTTTQQMRIISGLLGRFLLWLLPCRIICNSLYLHVILKDKHETAMDIY